PCWRRLTGLFVMAESSHHHHPHHHHHEPTSIHGHQDHEAFTEANRTHWKYVALPCTAPFSRAGGFYSQRLYKLALLLHMVESLLTILKRYLVTSPPDIHPS